MKGDQPLVSFKAPLSSLSVSRLSYPTEEPAGLGPVVSEEEAPPEEEASERLFLGSSREWVSRALQGAEWVFGGGSRKVITEISKGLREARAQPSFHNTGQPRSHRG